MLALVALGIGALAAIGNAGRDDGGFPTAETFSLTAAAETTLAARTVEFDATFDAAGVGAVTVSGAVDNEAGIMTISSDLSGLLSLGNTIPIGDGSMELVLDTEAATMYVGASGLGELLGAGTPWISADLSVLAERAGVPLEELRAQTFIDPTESARLLLESDDVTEVGTETIDGVETKHFRVTVDLTAALGALPQQLVGDVGEIGLPETVDYDVWVTAENELRRAALDVDVAGQTASIVLDMTTSDEPLDVEVPADAFDVTAWLDW